jgi:hypothetical protein
VELQNALRNSSVQGPRWLTGGAIGPKGGATDFVAVLLSCAVFARFDPAKNAASIEAATSSMRNYVARFSV